MITLDFSKAPGTSGSPFCQVLQVIRSTSTHTAVLQQFGRSWGYLILDNDQNPVACKWSMGWQAPQALAACNAVLETL